MKIPVAGLNIYLFDAVSTSDPYRWVFDFIRVEDESGQQDGVGVTITGRFIADPAPVAEIQQKVNDSLAKTAKAVEDTGDSAIEATVVASEAEPAAV